MWKMNELIREKIRDEENEKKKYSTSQWLVIHIIKFKLTRKQKKENELYNNEEWKKVDSNKKKYKRNE